jgi:uncharacterized protein YecE (DUF72 family)
MRALVTDPAASVPWLTAPLEWFGPRLGTVLYRVPDRMRVDVAGLTTLLGHWPRGVPVTFEFQDPSWHVDEVFAALRTAGAALCATDLPDADEPPTIRLTGSFIYLRLRRHDYAPGEVAAWAARLQPFLSSGTDVFAFFRHDEVGRGPELAEALKAAVDALEPEG